MPDGSFEKPKRSTFGQGPDLRKRSELAGKSRVCGGSPDQKFMAEVNLPNTKTIVLKESLLLTGDLCGHSRDLGHPLPNENPQDRNAGICAVQPESTQRMPLEDANEREEARWYDAATRFEIVFIVYSRRPCDWDGYDIKALQDFCCKIGVIPNDGWKTLSGRVVSRKAATEGEEKTEIEITAITL